MCCFLETTGLVREGLRLQGRELRAVRGVKHPGRRGSRQESPAVLGGEGCSLDGCSCALAPGKGSANLTKHGSWKTIKRTPRQEGNSSWAEWLPRDSRLSSDAKPCPRGIETSGEWGGLCPP